MKKNNTIKDRVRRILKTEGEISNWWAIDTRLTTRLSEVIRQLREEGMIIETTMRGKECTYILNKEQVIGKRIVKHLDNGSVRIVYEK